MEASKIHLSASELDLVVNREIILTKNVVINKMKQLLQKVQEMQLEFVNENNLNGNNAFSVAPKISRGENYMGLPYIVLDYPRIAAPGDFFFIRTMFWWGNFFSSTLQTSGKNSEIILNNVRLNIDNIKGKYYTGINNDPWHHHFEEINYVHIDSLESITNIIAQQREYIKLAAKWPLTDWPVAAATLFDSWKFLLKLYGLIT